MATVTIRVLEGLERGRIFSRLATPITIGREDDNDIQLNDDRVSRFHVKLQDDGGKVILTDLDSTNGTRVNGHPVQVKVLQVGDLLVIGRCVLLFGELPEWKLPQSAEDPEQAANQTALLSDESQGADNQDVEFLSSSVEAEVEPLFPHGAPTPPTDLRPLHRAQVSDVLAYLHEQIGEVLLAAQEPLTPAAREGLMECPRDAWLKLVSLQATLASYLRQIADPE